jgi:heavy metal sensor kinase
LKLPLRSVRVRLTLGYACALGVLLACFSAAVFLVVRASLLHELEERAEQNLAVIQGLVVEDPDEADEIDEHGIVPLFAILRDGAESYVSSAWRRQGLPEPASIAGGPESRRWRSDAGVSYVIASASDASAEPTTVLVAVEEAEVLELLRTLGIVLLLGFPVAVLGALLGGSLLAKRLLTPVGAMAEAAGRITAERLSERLPIDDPDDEFGRLAGVFNQTLARLEDAFERLRRFTGDASHELRTPLTALRSVGDVALRVPDFHAVCRETIVSMLEESERLTQLVDGLLMLTRESTETYRARFAPVDLGALSSEVVELFRALAEEKDQRLESLAEEPAVVHGDRGTLRQAIVNLVDNALKYTPRGGAIHVCTRVDSHDAIVEVADDGKGIAEVHRERVFERFYRVGDDRSRETGGVGLGLSIARWAVELNRGQIELESAPGKGSTFRLRVPRATHPASMPGAGPRVSTLNPVTNPSRKRREMP